MLQHEKLTLQHKIGQMVMCGFESRVPDEQIETLITKYKLGNVIYFRRNLDTPLQVFRLSCKLQELAEKEVGIPLLISIDQEGGMVNRTHEGVVGMPGNMTLGALRDPQAAYDSAYVSAEELRAIGINMNFAPCLDVNNNPDNPVIGVRSYGETAELVSKLGVEAMKGYQDGGVAATIKHFPGHGDTQADSHHALPLIPHPARRLRELELVPFQKAINAGADAVMSAHVIFPDLEPEHLPSTLSRQVMTRLLREEMGFDGVITTDCLEMKAIDDHYGVAEGAVKAIEAGVDLVLVSHTLTKQVAAIGAILQALESGRLTEERIDESVDRILRLKQKLKLERDSLSEERVRRTVGTLKHQKLAERLYERSITVVKDEGLLPLDKQAKTLAVWTEVRTGTEIDEVIAQQGTLGAYLSERMGNVQEIRIGTEPTDDERQKVLEAASLAEQIIFVSYNASFVPQQLGLIKSLEEVRDRFIVIAGRNPFDLKDLPTVKTFVSCYENRPMAMQAAAKVLTGETAPTGRLPVSITADYPIGSCC
ncbi:putative beta-hexosaminidase A [Paenibacillus larvae subsp. larvae DSM 25430]|nr:beta-N-acetylhexosaminidase [Paenibacillus larvae]AVG11339.1 putative beta-hexosaminidase A [Paenibacillus larvae subsp. larvae DSM 25430]